MTTMRTTLAILMIGMVLTPAVVLAASVPTIENVDTAQGITLSSIETLVQDAFNYFAEFAAIAVVAGIIYAGFLMATSGADSDRYENGKKILKQVVIAAAVIFGVGVIVNTIANFAQSPSSVIQ